MSLVMGFTPAVTQWRAVLDRQGGGQWCRQWVTHRAGSCDPATSFIHFGPAMMPKISTDVTAGIGVAGCSERDGAHSRRADKADGIAARRTKKSQNAG
jgi:hypothetical protein